MEQVLRDPFPFEHVQVKPEIFEELKRQTIEWAHRWLSLDDSQIEFAYVFLKHCSPQNVELKELMLASSYLLWFVAFNDIPNGPERVVLLQEISETIRGVSLNGKSVNPQIIDATTELLKIIAIEHSAKQILRLKDFLLKLVEYTRLEALCEDGLLPVSEYLKLRQHTIAAHPYLEIFRLNWFRLDNVAIEDHSTSLEMLEYLTVKGLYLVNDVLSTKRDIRKVKQNFVLCLSKEKEISIDEARDEVLQETFKTMSDIALYSKEISKNTNNKSLSQYAEFLGTVQEGNRVSTLELYDRYFGTR